jgi:serine-type D-Ala-D-Ala endopeptidase (penicillin-binding protein 7)
MKLFFKKLVTLFALVAIASSPALVMAKSKKVAKTEKTAHVKVSKNKSSKIAHAKTAKSKVASASQRKKVILANGGNGKRSKNIINVSVRNTYKPMRAYTPIETLPAIEEDLDSPLALASNKALVINQLTNEVVFAKNTNTPTPIASVTKLMTAMVVLDASLDMHALVDISDEDVDYLKGTSSRLAVGAEFSRDELMHMALISSENRAASALATSYPGGKGRFVREMNKKAKSLGMFNTHFSDSTGLDSSNVSTAEDLAKMVNAAYQYPVIREITTTQNFEIYLPNHENMSTFNNTNALVKSDEWEVGLSKTGFINEAGRCLVMQAKVAGEPMIIVLLDSVGKYTRIGDANRVKKWVEYHAKSKPMLTQQTDLQLETKIGQVY